jgi:hypothetical protein
MDGRTHGSAHVSPDGGGGYPGTRALFVAVMSLFLILMGASPPAAAAGASIRLSPGSGSAGTEVTLSGDGFSSDREDLQVWFDSKKILSDVVSDSSGHVSAKFTVPGSAAKGLRPVYLLDGVNRASARFDVTASADTERAPGKGDDRCGPGEEGRCGPGQAGRPDLEPTAIVYRRPVVRGQRAHFDSGVSNRGGARTPVFNVKWYVDGREVGAYGSHSGVPGHRVVLNGNSQFSWSFSRAGRHTVTFRVDVDNHVAESDERNNSRTETVLVMDRGAGSLPTSTDRARMRNATVTTFADLNSLCRRIAGCRPWSRFQIDRFAKAANRIERAAAMRKLTVMLIQLDVDAERADRLAARYRLTRSSNLRAELRRHPDLRTAITRVMNRGDATYESAVDLGWSTGDYFPVPTSLPR